jgi:L-ribulokinase
MTRAVAIGLDFGTGSARAALIDLDSGAAAAEHTASYRTGARDAGHAGGLDLPANWVVQDPADFVAAAAELLGWAAAAAAGQGAEIAVIGVTATSCTVLPTRRDGTPLLHLPAFAGRPHAYAKLWKHHAAEPYARRIGAARPDFLRRYDMRTSSEWSLAKAWQVMEEDPGLWAATERWIDLGDWLVWQLTGTERRSASQAGCKNHWQPDQGGYPAAAALDAIAPGLASWRDRLAPPSPLGTLAGPLTRAWQAATGIGPRVPVAVAVVDAAAAVPGSDVATPGIFVAAIGTSTCHMSLSAAPVAVPGIESTVFGGAINGLFDYCTGQPATGDMFGWLAGLLARYGKATTGEIFAALLAELDPDAAPSPVAVMDSWNGCRTPLGRDDLGGRIAGLTMTTTPADIYRAMLEAAAMGMRYAHGLHARIGPLDEIRVTGGMARFPAVMQLYADVIGQPLNANPTGLGSARGAAILAAAGLGHAVPAALGYTCYTPRAPERYAARYADYVAQIARA